jgi:class 3 adenylate cyclase/tetratricopeptide (TPR) repeat protein
VAADARFCSHCGAALTPAPAAETRRVVTALFADVVGSTALGERMDPEDFGALMESAVGRMVSAVDALGGSVEHLAGDGLLALFGAPVAHEDDAERAVLAGLRIVADIRAYAASAGPRYAIDPPTVRVGIETGLAVIAPVDAGGHTRLAATGDALNTAARLQGAARPGTVLVGPRSRELVAPLFRWGAERDLRLKGKETAVQAVEAVERRAASEVAVPSAPESGFVGRRRELAIARNRLVRTVAGSGGVLLVSGEPGIGKSRLLRELQRHAAASGVLWLSSRGVSYGAALPYLPFRTLLADWPAALEDAAALAPILEPGGLPPAGSNPSAVQRRAFDAVRSLLEGRARDGPVVVALDDVNWLDGSSVALLQHLVAATAETGLLLVLAGRPDEGGPLAALRATAAVGASDRTSELTLEPLHGAADRDLLLGLVGAGTLPPELERRMLERADGNPFFLEELVGALLQTGALDRRADGLHYVGGTDVEVPETVERVLLARIDRLPGPAGEVLRAASVLGRRFPLPLLHAVVEPGRSLDEELAELHRHDLLRGGEDELRFKHSLIQEAAYHSLLRRRRQDLHARAAEALERLAPNRHGLLAHHWSEAGRPERAVERHALAAESAFGVYALEEALEHADRGLEAGARLGPSSHEARLRELLCLRGKIRFFRGDLSGGAADAEAALEAARAAGDRRLAMDALIDLSQLRHEGVDRALSHGEEAVRIAESLGDAHATVHSLSRVSILLSNRLRLDLALDHGERALRLAHEAADEQLEGRALDAIKLAALELGDLDTLELSSGRAADIHRRLDDRFFLSFALLESAFVPLARGAFAAARERLEDALAVNAELGDLSSRPLFLDTLCWLERSRGDYRSALQAGLEAHELARAAGSSDFVAWSTSSLGWTLLETGRPDRAAEILGEGLEAVAGTGAAVQLVLCGGLLAAAESALGHANRAAELAERVEELLERMTAPPGGTFLYGAHAQLAVADVRLEGGDHAAAERLAEPLLAAAERVGWHETVARAACLMARCRRASGDGPAAEALLRRALEVAHEAGLPAAEREARTALGSA